MDRRWFVQRTNPEYVAYLSRAAAVSPVLAQILINRGISTPEVVDAFLTNTFENLSDPMSLGGVAEALEAVEEAGRQNLRVMVHGDYDTDGLTGTAIMVDALKRIGLDVITFIPNRFSHGYGFNVPAVEFATEKGASLIITVDCGITSFEAASLAATRGIGVVITDHHEPVHDNGTFRVPDALAIVNPKLTNPEISGLSGAGVALKFVHALSGKYPGKLRMEDFLDLATLGTMADSVPLVGENRAIVKEGLDSVFESRRPGIRALADVARLGERQRRAEILNFTLVPRLNAAGRISDAAEALELLLSSDENHAREIAESLDDRNTERQRIEEQVLTEALEMIERRGGKVPSAIVIAGEGWHEGVVGIVASRLVDRFNRPSVVLSIRDGIAKGSARSIPQFDIYQGLVECSEHLIGFGGHRQAAGLRLNMAAFDALEQALNEEVERQVNDFTVTLTLDASVELREVTFRFMEEMEQLAPFGYGNPEPVLGVKGLNILDARVVGTNHLKLKLRSGSVVMDAIGFAMGDDLRVVEGTASIDAAFSPSINEWEGKRSLQMNLKGLRPSVG